MEIKITGIEKVSELDLIKDLDLNDRSDFEYFVDFVQKELKGKFIQTTTNGFKFEVNIKYKNILDELKIDYTMETVTNKEHPEYGKKYLEFNLFRPRWN